VTHLRREVSFLCIYVNPASQSRYFLYACAILSDQKPPSTPNPRYAVVAQLSALCLSDNLVYGLGEVVDIVGIQASHTDPSILCHVNMGNISQLQNLLF
jgi:hypothetical protein